MAFSLEGDGLLENLYYYVWMKASQDDGFRGFYLPDTVVYKYQQPWFWFFTSVKKQVKKKTKDKLNAATIQEQFLKHVSRSGIVATYTFMSDNRRVIEFLGVEEFNHFLHYRKKTVDGVLQKYIDPKGKHETQLQIVWSPEVSLFEIRENKKDLYDLRFDLYERCVTFEGEEYHCNVTPLKGNVLKNWLKNNVRSLVEHIEEVTYGKIQVKRLVLNFKMDKKENIWLLGASSVRSGNEKIQPLALESSTRLPDTVNTKKVSLNPQCPMSIQRTVLCRNCTRAYEPDRMCEVTYRVIVAFNPAPEIPPLISTIHPKLELDDYLKYKHNPLFLNKQTLVCDTCFLNFNQVNNVDTLEIPRPKPLRPAGLILRREMTMKHLSILTREHLQTRENLQTRASTAGFRPVTAAGGEFELPRAPRLLTRSDKRSSNTLNNQPASSRHIDLKQYLKDHQARKKRRSLR